MQRKSQMEMSNQHSSTNFLSRSNSPRLGGDSMRDSMHSSYGIASKQIRIGVSQQQSALPPSDLEYSFMYLVPFVIFSVIKQLHVLYLIIMSAFMLLKYCEVAWDVLTVQICLTMGYIGIEIIGRYFTFKLYTRHRYFNDANYYCWNKRQKDWQKVDEQYIKVGQIIKIQKKISNSTLEESQFVDASNGNGKVRVPINLLPIKLPSGQRQVSIDTFDTDKQEAAIKISIMKNFDRYFESIQYVKHTISEDCLIQYTFFNPISESFEATISFKRNNDDGITKQISNADTIPRGAYFCNEKELVGVALFNLEEKNFKHIKHILGSRNSIATLLQRHLILVILGNIVVSGLLLVVNVLISTIELHTIFKQIFHCYFFNYFSLLSFSINVVMYIILGFHQIIDSLLIRRKSSIEMNNYIKSVDEFGVADTFVMDEFSFVKKNILQVCSIEINGEQTTSLFDEEIILIIVEKSVEFQTKYQNQWLSLTHYYLSKYGRGSSKKKQSFIIESEKIDIGGSIRIIVSFQNFRKFIVRFNQKVIFSVLESVTIDKQLYFSEKILQGKENGQLMLMVEILEIKSDVGIDLSVLMYEMEFKFLCLIKLKFLPRSQSVDFLRYLKNKYKIIIMTSSSLQYFDKILLSANLKTQKDYLMIFDETEENDFQKEMAQKIQQYKKHKYKHEQKDDRFRKESGILSEENVALSSEKNSSYIRRTIGGFLNKNEEDVGGGDMILALHSSLIIYLGRPSIRELLQQLSKISTYIIFYDCTQFQKQLCSASVFKIFPQHIFLSNFAIDANTFRISNLSMCISKYSAARYTTATAENYELMKKFISKECVTSIQLTTIIIKTHIFKNQCLIWSMLVANLLVYKGRYMFVGQQFSIFMMFFFNVPFTVLPIIYYLMSRPELVGDILVEDYKDYKLRYEHIKGVLSGTLITLLTYALIPQEQIMQVFIGVIFNSTYMANYYHLVVDDSVSKRNQVIIIIIQWLLSIGTYFLTLFVDTTYALFPIGWNLHSSNQSMALFYCCIFLINPFIILMIFFFMSFHKSILMKDRRIEKKKLEDRQIKSSLKKQQIVARVGKSSGKQMKFRGLDARPDFF